MAQTPTPHHNKSDHLRRDDAADTDQQAPPPWNSSCCCSQCVLRVAAACCTTRPRMPSAASRGRVQLKRLLDVVLYARAARLLRGRLRVATNCTPSAPSGMGVTTVPYSTPKTKLRVSCSHAAGHSRCFYLRVKHQYNTIFSRYFAAVKAAGQCARQSLIFAARHLGQYWSRCRNPVGAQRGWLRISVLFASASKLCSLE